MKTSKHAKILQDENSRLRIGNNNIEKPPHMNNIEKSLDHFFKELKHTAGPWVWIDNPSDTKTALELIVHPDADHSGGDSILYHGADWSINAADSKLIACAPDLLRSVCRMYLYFLVNKLDASRLPSLRNDISNATGLDAKYIQDCFEQYALWIQLDQELPAYKNAGE